MASLLRVVNLDRKQLTRIADALERIAKALEVEPPDTEFTIAHVEEQTWPEEVDESAGIRE